MINLVRRNCKNCNNNFEAIFSEVKRGRAKFCSKSCALAFRNKSLTGSKLVSHKCKHCKKDVIRNKGDFAKKERNGFKNVFCSNICHGNFRNKKGKCVCLICEKEFYKSMAFIKDGRGKFCSKECQAEWQKMNFGGKKWHTYKHGLSKDRRYWALKSHERRVKKQNNGGEYDVKEWELVKKRFKHRCPFCGEKEPKIKLTVDHILPILFGGTNDISNIQPLCLPCNSRKHTKLIKFHPSGQTEFSFQEKK